MARVYATTEQYEAYAGQAGPSNIGQLLADASRFLDAQVFRLCWYEADAETGLPTNTTVTEAFADATCAQAQWWDQVGDSVGAVGAGWSSVSIGSVSLSGGQAAGAASAARQVAPKAADALAVLTPDIFRLGQVTTW